MLKEIRNKYEMSPITRKVILILGLAIFLNIPLCQVEQQTTQRKQRETEAQEQVAKGWGADVAVGSPYLEDNSRFIHPQSIQTTLNLNSSEKKRGAFKLPVYMGLYKSKIVFNKNSADLFENKSSSLEAHTLTIPIEPSSSIQSFKIKDVQTGQDLKGKVISGGIQVSLDQAAIKSFYDRDFEVEVLVRGTGSLKYSTKALTDSVRFSGNWAKPKFFDEILPTSTQLNSNGFVAEWNLNTLPTSFLQEVQPKTVGMTHMWLKSDYAAIERLVKYGILFIALTFMLLFIGEVMFQVCIHPFQYGLVGLAISMFYLLVLALSEVFGFDVAYIFSAMAVTGLNLFYVLGFLKEKKFVKLLLTEQLGLSVFFYVLLTLEESAFLVGTLGLFAALAVLMGITRHFDWYSGSFRSEEGNQIEN